MEEIILKQKMLQEEIRITLEIALLKESITDKILENCRVNELMELQIEILIHEKHLKLLPQVFKIDLPEDLINAVESAKNNEAVKQIGIEWAINQCKELLDFGVPVLHFYSMGKSDNIKKVAGELF